MISRLHIENYKALRSVDLALTPLHVLIGPNDTGKTSILEALAALARSVDHDLPSAFTGLWDGRDLVWLADPDACITVEVSLAHGSAAGAELDDAVANGDCRYFLSCRFPAKGKNVVVQSERAVLDGKEVDFERTNHRMTRVCGVLEHNAGAPAEVQQAARAISHALVGVHFYRWTPRFLALPVALDSRRRFRMEASGFGLALCLDDILGYDRALFSRLEERFCGFFPQFCSIKLISEPAFRSPPDDAEQVPLLQKADGKGIYLEPAAGGRLVPASQASDGTLLVLAYLAVLHLPSPPSLILIEEPENGMHPKRLEEMIEVLRELVVDHRSCQVLLTTHSPYLLDHFSPEEVTLCTRRDDGAIQVRTLSESRSVQNQAGIFTLGEIWTAEGDTALANDADAAEAAGQ